MCRLYGFRASEPTKVECSLVYAQNALLHQSHKDERGLSNSDGWGISYYQDSHAPIVERRNAAAHHCAEFSQTAERIYASTVLAHVRAATVGKHSLNNTHPFTFNNWSFAHNGTVHGFSIIRDELEQEIDADLLACRLGETDSETCFYWLLSRLRSKGIELTNKKIDQSAIVAEVAEAILTLDSKCHIARPEKPARLNWLFTNGHHMYATRWRNSLYLLERDGVHDCEICGIPHIHHDLRAHYRAVCIASEPITHEEWHKIPDGSLVLVNANYEVSTHSIA